MICVSLLTCNKVSRLMVTSLVDKDQSFNMNILVFVCVLSYLPISYFLIINREKRFGQNVYLC